MLDVMENFEAKEQKTPVKSLVMVSSAAVVKMNLPTHKNTLGMTQCKKEKKAVIFTAKTVCGFAFKSSS